MMAFSEEDKDRLFRHWTTIKKNVEMKYIVDVLIEERVISPDEWEDMKKSHPLEKDRTEAFLHLLMKQPRKSYDAFLKALQNGKYDFIFEKLDRNMPRDQPPADLPTQSGGGHHDRDDYLLFSPRNFKILWEKVNDDGEQIRRKLEALKKEIEEWKSILRKKEKEIKKLQEKYQKKEEECGNLKETLVRQKTEIMDVKEEMKDVKSKLKKAEEEVEQLRRENTHLSRQNTLFSRSTRPGSDAKDFRQEDTFVSEAARTTSPDATTEASIDSVRREIGQAEEEIEKRKMTKNELKQRVQNSKICCLQ